MNLYGRSKRPRVVTVLVWAVFLLGLLNGWRAAGLLRQFDVLNELNPSISITLQIGFSVTWLVIFVFLTGALLLRYRPVRWMIPAGLLVYLLLVLLRLFLFVQAPVTRATWVVTLSLMVSLIVLSIWGLNRAIMRDYWRS